MAESAHGRFVWYEMLTVDKGPTIDFYKEVVGWDTQEWESGEQPYTMFTVGEAPGGQVLNGPMDVPGGDRVAQCLDPQGAPFALHSTKGAEA
jgi:predicted enzyme related to lactoylglutathione lyase